MIGDKLIFRDRHYAAADKIMETIKPYHDRRTAISIGGESGTGKSEIAFILRDRYYNQGIRVQLVSLDDYYKTSWKERRDWREKNFSLIGAGEMDWDRLHRVLDMYKTGIQVRTTRINKYTYSREINLWDAESVDLLIFEGLYALGLNTDFKIHVSGSYKETKDFRTERGKEIQDKHRDMVLERESEAVQKLKEKADLEV